MPAVALNAYGWRVTFEQFTRSGHRPVTAKIGVKTQHGARARQTASRKSGFLRVITCEPLSEEEYRKEFRS